MNTKFAALSSISSQLAVILLASAIGGPANAQQTQAAGNPSGTTPSAALEQPSPVATQSTARAPKEGFWGRVNPFARKKWVNDRVNPLRGRLDELDEVSARNARDIKDVDSRAQAGIRQAQSTADSANQKALAADGQAQTAYSAAQGASTHVDQLNTTVAGLDQYHQASEVEVTFRGSQPILSATARKKLDDLAANLTSRRGYILEIEGHSLLAGSAGIQSSGRQAEAVKRYLVTTHEIPVYRIHSLALGNVKVTAEEQDSTSSVKANCVRIRLMENTLAAQKEVAPPPGVASLTGAERP